jgi:hypothetical protein
MKPGYFDCDHQIRPAGPASHIGRSSPFASLIAASSVSRSWVRPSGPEAAPRASRVRAPRMTSSSANRQEAAAPKGGVGHWLAPTQRVWTSGRVSTSATAAAPRKVAHQVVQAPAPVPGPTAPCCATAACPVHRRPPHPADPTRPRSGGMKLAGNTASSCQRPARSGRAQRSSPTPSASEAATSSSAA